ncbi:hypothetical protein SAMN06298216_1814 [Spirosomataceae bacterium TFI 002]|nr:hypothetical protein SAMN06298216_1814 [Spirosomataceae bacterium TFI 002]
MRYLLLLSIIGLFACERDLPKKPTIINGKVLDENENPIPFVFVYFYGTGSKGLQGADITFYQQMVTLEDGSFLFSKITPKETVEYNFAALGELDQKRTPQIPEGFKYIYYFNDKIVSDFKIGGFLSIDENLLKDTLTVKIKLTKK